MTSDTRYREVDVSGPPRELGQQIGEALGEEIRGFCDVALERVNKTTGVTREQAVAVATDCLALADDYNDTLPFNGIEPFPVVADPENFELNRLQVSVMQDGIGATIGHRFLVAWHRRVLLGIRRGSRHG